MSLSIKDVYATVLVGVTAGLYWARTKGIAIPFIGNNRIFSLVVLILGLTICAIGAGSATWPVPKNNMIIQLTAGLGFLGLGLSLLGILTGNKLFIQLLVSEIIVLWVMTTIRHFVQ